MVVVRFRVTCKPEKLKEAVAAFQDVVAPSRSTPGVINFDIAQDITDPTALIATEVFENQAALERQESLLEVQKVIGMLGDCVTGPPEATIFHVSSSEPWG